MLLFPNMIMLLLHRKKNKEIITRMIERIISLDTLEGIKNF